MASPSVVPNNTLTIPNPTPPPEKVSPTPANRFIMFGDSWLQLQTLVASALKLPINKGDFAAKYGDFPAGNKKEVAGCLQAMVDLRNLSSSFGNPMTIKQEIATNGSYLTTQTPPDALYGHIVWLAMQIENAASTFSYTFLNLQPLLSPSAGTPAERGANLRMILTGPGGLVSTASDMQKLTAALLSKLARFDTQVSDASTQIQIYSGSQSKILADANKLLGRYSEDLTTLTEASDTAYAAWRSYTIAAVTSSVLVTILSGGLLWFVGLGLGIGLGVAAAKQMALYNDLLTQIEDKKIDVQKKTLLVTDLSGLNAKVPGVVSAVADFKTKLEVIEGVWTNIGGNLNYIASNYTDEQLSSYPWVQQAMKIGDACNKWQSISTTASQFTQHSLVTYNSDISFGQRIGIAA